jgi:hypothetical protein
MYAPNLPSETAEGTFIMRVALALCGVVMMQQHVGFEVK